MFRQVVLGLVVMSALLAALVPPGSAQTAKPVSSDAAFGARANLACPGLSEPSLDPNASRPLEAPFGCRGDLVSSQDDAWIAVSGPAGATLAMEVSLTGFDDATREGWAQACTLTLSYVSRCISFQPAQGVFTRPEYGTLELQLGQEGQGWFRVVRTDGRVHYEVSARIDADCGVVDPRTDDARPVLLKSMQPCTGLLGAGATADRFQLLVEASTRLFVKADAGNLSGGLQVCLRDEPRLACSELQEELTLAAGDRLRPVDVIVRRDPQNTYTAGAVPALNYTLTLNTTKAFTLDAADCGTGLDAPDDLEGVGDRDEDNNLRNRIVNDLHADCLGRLADGNDRDAFWLVLAPGQSLRLSLTAGFGALVTDASDTPIAAFGSVSSATTGPNITATATASFPAVSTWRELRLLVVREDGEAGAYVLGVDRNRPTVPSDCDSRKEAGLDNEGRDLQEHCIGSLGRDDFIDDYRVHLARGESLVLDLLPARSLGIGGQVLAPTGADAPVKSSQDADLDQHVTYVADTTGDYVIRLYAVYGGGPYTLDAKVLDKDLKEIPRLRPTAPTVTTTPTLTTPTVTQTTTTATVPTATVPTRTTQGEDSPAAPLFAVALGLLAAVMARRR